MPAALGAIGNRYPGFGKRLRYGRGEGLGGCHIGGLGGQRLGQPCLDTGLRLALRAIALVSDAQATLPITLAYAGCGPPCYRHSAAA